MSETKHNAGGVAEQQADRLSENSGELDSAVSSANSANQPQAAGSLWRRFYTSDFNFEFVGRWRTWLIISLVMLAVCVGSLALRGLNLGVEFTGGSVFQAPTIIADDTVSRVNQAAVDSAVPNLNVQVSTLGERAVRVQTRSLETDEVVKVRTAIANELNIAPDEVAYTLVGPSWGKQITNRSAVALGVFIVLVFAMIWIFFRDWKMSLSAILALVHDMVVTVGLYALLGFSVSPATVIGFLTILAYSLYDTVVVFDKVNENTAGLERQNRTYAQAANASVNQVLVRSINTTVIAVLPVAAIMIAGLIVLNGEGPLADLGLALLIGMITGAYSSLCIATPLLVQLRQREPEIQAHDQRVRSGKLKTRARKGSDNSTDDQGAAQVALATAGGANVFLSDTKPTKSQPSTAQGGHSGAASAADKRQKSDAAAGRPQPKNASRSQRKK